MTFYEVACIAQHMFCNIAEEEVSALVENNDGLIKLRQKYMQGAIDRAYVLGEMIDNLSVELAEREV